MPRRRAARAPHPTDGATARRNCTAAASRRPARKAKMRRLVARSAFGQCWRSGSCSHSPNRLASSPPHRASSRDWAARLRNTIDRTAALCSRCEQTSSMRWSAARRSRRTNASSRTPPTPITYVTPITSGPMTANDPNSERGAVPSMIAANSSSKYSALITKIAPRISKPNSTSPRRTRRASIGGSPCRYRKNVTEQKANNTADRHRANGDCGLKSRRSCSRIRIASSVPIASDVSHTTRPAAGAAKSSPTPVASRANTATARRRRPIDASSSP